MIKLNKVSDRLDKAANNIIVVSAGIVALFLFVTPKPTGYELMFLHPLIFAILFSFCEPLKHAKFTRPSLLVLFLTMYIRYILAPLLLALGDYPELSVSYSSYVQKAVILMVYEELLVFIVIKRYGKSLLMQNKKDYLLCILKPNLYYISIICFGFYLFFSTPEISDRYHFVFTLTGEEYDIAKKQLEINEFFAFIINATRYIVVILVLSVLYKKNQLSQKPIYFQLSLFVIGLNMMIIFDISRFNMMIPTAALTYLIIQLYPEHKGSILRICFIAALVVVGYSTFIKMFADARGGDANASSVSSWAETIQMYFMGQRDVGVGLYTGDQMRNWGVLYFLNDFFGQIMLVHRLTIPEISPIMLYNFEYNEGPFYDKILPNLSAGYTYFGIILSPLITVVFVYLSLLFDKLSFTVNRIEFRFLLIYGALISGFVMMQFYPMIINVLINTLFLMFIVFRINVLILSKKNKA